MPLIFLIKKGYKIRERNYRFNKAEVDIIAEYENLIIFVEVKTRHSDYLAEPELTVHRRKQWFIKRVANQYLRYNNLENWGRFDIISIILHSEGTEIRHLEGAFT